MRDACQLDGLGSPLTPPPLGWERRPSTRARAGEGNHSSANYSPVSRSSSALAGDDSSCPSPTYHPAITGPSPPFPAVRGCKPRSGFAEHMQMRGITPPQTIPRSVEAPRHLPGTTPPALPLLTIPPFLAPPLPSRLRGGANRGADSRSVCR